MGGRPADRLDAYAGDPARPLLTWYDDGTGERVELSGATLGNWVAKTANLLVDGCGLGIRVVFPALGSAEAPVPQNL